MSQQQKDDYVMGLLLALIVFSAIPITSSAALWLSVLLLALVWLPVIQGKYSLSGTQTVSGVPTSTNGNAA